MRRRTQLAIVCMTLAASLLPLAPASATLDRPPKVRESFDDSPCGVPVHVDIVGTNPVVLTGRIFDDGDIRIVNTGHLVQRFTASDGRWMEDDFSGPASRIFVTSLSDGSTLYRVGFSGIKRQFLASDGASVRDIGRLVVDYVFDAHGDFVSRTLVSQQGDFPIASGNVGFCEFLVSHIG